MDDEHILNVVKQLELVLGRKAMFIGSNSASATGAYLSGYESAAMAFGVQLPHEMRQLAKEERGWIRSAEVWPMIEMRERDLSDEAIADEMLAIDIAAWRRMIDAKTSMIDAKTSD